MNGTRWFLTLSCALLWSGTASAANVAGAPPSPKPWMKTVVERGRDLALRKVEAGTPAEDKWKSETKSLIDDTLDWPEMTQQALGRQWEKLSGEQQKKFATMLREMIEASYQSKLKLVTSNPAKKPGQVNIEWGDDRIEGNDASVSARIKAEKTNAMLDFKMKWKDGRWRVWDVSIDEVSTVRTYRTQFAKIIGKDGFDALLARMKSKTAEIREGRAEIGP